MAGERCATRNTLLILMVCVVKQLVADELTCDPKSVTLKDFNIDKFLGLWHELYHYPAEHQELYSCFIDDYEKTPGGDITITSSLYDNIQRRRDSSAGEVQVSDNVLDITYPNRKEWSSVYYVAATDYEQFSIVVGCPEITATELNVYVMFRSTNPDEDARKAAEEALEPYNLNINDFYKEC